MRLIIATKNRSKVKEIKEILSGVPYKICSLQDLPENFEIVEDGKTFDENALKKSLAVSRVYRDDYVVGEDSGLSVEYLAGEPGVYSRRYSGKDATDLKNNHKLLKALEEVPPLKRKAEFVCFLSLAFAGREEARFEGRVKGLISECLLGQEGFGYDPIFYLPKQKKTMAQLSLSEKNRISHRAKAFFQLRRFLMENCFN